MNKTKISIITLTYNNWRVLALAVESVAQQIIPDEYEVEYLVVDDGTKDFDYSYVYKLLSNKFPFQYRILENEKNVGTVKSFNNAIKESHGDIIIQLSADDQFYDENVVNDIAEKFRNPKVSIVTAKRIPTLNGVALESRPTAHEITLFSDREKLLDHLLKHNSFISGACTYYRKETLVQLNYFDESYKLLDDYPFYVKALLNNIDISFLNKVSIKYSLGGVSSIERRNPLLAQDFKRFYIYLSSLDRVNVFFRRRIYYSKVLTLHERIRVKNILIFPEQFIILLVLKFIKKFRH